MKKICLLTSEESFLTNFGAALQGYALYRVLKDAEYDVKIQRYLGGCFSEAEKFNENKIKKGYSIVEIYLKILFRIGKLVNKSRVNAQKAKFQEFQDKYMNFYKGERKTWKTLKDSYPIADLYLCGSDQIWNPMFKNGFNDPGYFLSFTEKNKIAYAPSFGIEDIPITSQNNLAKLLESFDFISVREKKGAEIIKKYTGIDAKVTLDPTLLIDETEWRKIGQQPPNIPEKYILCYRFGNSLKVNKAINEISRTLKLPIIELPLSGISYYNITNKRLFEAGPSEFVSLIDNATLVCTDSFHATVFSVLMETPFVTFLRGEDIKKSEGMNSRVTNVLNILDLNNRIITNINAKSKDELLECDFTKAKKYLHVYRKDSLDWLLNSITQVLKDE